MWDGESAVKSDFPVLVGLGRLKEHPGIEPGPHNGVGPSGVGKAQSAKASSMVPMLFLLLHCQAVALKSPATSSIC